MGEWMNELVKEHIWGADLIDAVWETDGQANKQTNKQTKKQTN